MKTSALSNAILGSVGLILFLVGVASLAVAGALFLHLTPVPHERLADGWYWFIGSMSLILGIYLLVRAPVSFFKWVSLIHAPIVGGLLALVLLGAAQSGRAGKITIHWSGPQTPEFFAFFVVMFFLWLLSPLCFGWCVIREGELPKDGIGRAALILSVGLLLVSFVYLWMIAPHTTIEP